VNVDEFLALVELPHNSNRFVLGPFDPGITLFRQQTRGLNLLYALKESSRLKPKQRIAIIGGGVAGVTAAAAAATLGFSTTLIERRHSLIHLQQGCDTRWLHPHIYDWPEPGAFRVYAGLPLLDWYAASAANVAKQIVQQFEKIRASTKKITVCLGSTIDAIEDTRISWRSTNPRQQYDRRKFDAIIFAVGFGIESNLNSGWPSYWRNDSIHQPEPGGTPERKTSYLISGTGDGGLIDLMRVTIGGFDHESIHRELFEASPKLLFERLLQIKERWKSNSGVRDPNWLHDQYDEIETELLDEARERIKSRLRPDTRVYLNGTSDKFAQTLRLDKASMFNTLVAYCLRQLDAFEYRAGKLTLDGHTALVDGTEVKHDQLVVRHGADVAAVYVAAGCDQVREILDSRDKIRLYLSTASRLWPPGWWNNDLGVEHVSQPTVALATTFVSTLRDMVGLAGEASPDNDHSGADFRITMHRLCRIQGEFYYQQIARYAGTERDQGRVGRVFGVNKGLGGLCCRVGRPVRLTKGKGFEELQRELKLHHTPARPIGKGTASFLTVPFFTSSDQNGARTKVILLLYVSSTRPNFFSDTILKTICTACRGFVSNVEEMLKQGEIHMSSADFDGYESQNSATDNQLFEMHREILTTDVNIFDQYVTDLTFESVQFFEVSPE
jgi:hypothetical protein